ncbi:unnamed protein product [Gongylonema pulchrum]|uniref:tRNA (34-2'-O)-methyltransferase regulator WDR6 n=1 Tax=Gongylonema pulchrum TaxID=637853 RepID=A0A3P6PBB6_9BILA|nr:unnamed protein product [Gongylonema pulchrum]
MSIGRDGKLRIWLIEDHIQLLFWRRPSSAIEMEWPCKFVDLYNELFIAGFHGHCVCELACGGGHRSWQLSIPHESTDRFDGPNFVYFEFVIKGRISRILVPLNQLRIVKPHLHLSSITSVATFKCGMEEFYVTGGIDAMLVISQFRSTGSVEVIQRLPVHSSSIYALCARGNYLISAGGKSEIFIFHLHAGNLRQVFNMRLKGDCRLLSIQLLAVTPCIQFIVSSSDGRLLFYSLTDDLKATEHCVALIDPLTNPGIITKIATSSVNSPVPIISCAAISTAGLFYLWENVNDFDKNPDIIEVEKCGLSALDIYAKDGMLYVGIGSESGSITVFQMEDKQKFKKCTNRWHSATCTDLRFHQTSESFLVISVALDCRLAIFSYSFPGKLDFQQSLLLNISDPSSLIISVMNSSGVAKCIVTGTSVCIVLLDNTYPFIHRAVLEN